MEVYTKTKKKEPINSENILCQACLSADRHIFYLNGFTDLYHKICDFPLKESSEVYLCWECIALLRKIKLFKEKAQISQKILKYGLRKKKSHKGLSTLSVSNTVVLDSFLEIKKEEEEELLNDSIEVEIKQEPKIEDGENLGAFIDEYQTDGFTDEGVNFGDSIDDEQTDDIKYESDNFSDSVDNDQTDNIKDETVPQISQEHNNVKKRRVQTKHYEIKYPCKGRIVKKITVDPKDVHTWVEREKNSDYFKKLSKKCTSCFSNIKKAITLEDHYETFHLKSKNCPYFCDICEHYVTSKEALDAHVKQHYITRRCSVCGYECYTAANMRDHIKMHDKIVQCLKCDASFQNLRDLNRHSRAIHKQFICDYCNKISMCKSGMEKHILRVHLRPAVNRCGKCNVIFKNNRDLNRHIKFQHTIERSEATYCVPCNKQFDNIILLNRHVQTAVAHKSEWTKKPKDPIPCPECSKTFLKKCNMMNHYRFVHTNSSRFRCTVCNKPFINGHVLRTHRKTVHEGVKPAKNKLCTICGRGFAKNRILQNHIRTHTGERPHQCTFCDSKFAQRTAMMNHIKHIHLKAKRK